MVRGRPFFFFLFLFKGLAGSVAVITVTEPLLNVRFSGWVISNPVSVKGTRVRATL